MKVSVIDVGTLSIKHYIFNIDGVNKILLHYKRFSDANLGESQTLTTEAIQRNLDILSRCIKLNREEGVLGQEILGTEILRKAANASNFIDAVKSSFGLDIQIISQDKEALYLYEGFINVVSEDFEFAAVNTGGGSTEVVIGSKTKLASDKKLPFGVKFLKNNFSTDATLDWESMDNYLSNAISFSEHVPNLFITGILHFIAPVGESLGFIFEKGEIPNHPIKMTIDTYQSFVAKLRATPIDELKKYYTKDPSYCENVAIGQSAYLAVAKKLGANIIIPSDNDLTDGVIYEMMKSDRPASN